MEELLTYAEQIFAYLIRATSIFVWVWVVYVMLRALPLMLSSQTIRLRNLLASGLVILSVLVAIAYVPRLAVDAIATSYDETMPELNRLVDRIIVDLQTGYTAPAITVTDEPIPLPTATAIAPIPTIVPTVLGQTPVSTPPPTAIVPTQLPPTSTPMPTATPEEIFDWDSWQPGMAVPTPEIYNGNGG